MNSVVLRGHLSSDPQARELASGSVLWSFEITTPTDEGAWSVPVAWFDPPAVPVFVMGDEVVVRGGVRRRFFRTVGGTQSRTEVVACDIVAASAKRKVQRLVAREVERLGAVAGGEVPSK